MSSPLGSLQSVASSLPFGGALHSAFVLFSGTSTPIGSPPPALGHSLPIREPSSISRSHSMRVGSSSGSTSHPSRHSHAASTSGYFPPTPSNSRQVGPVRPQHDRRHSLSTHTAMQLSTSCDNCGERVSVDVPRWITDAIEQRNVQLDSERIHAAPPMSRVTSGVRIPDGREWRDKIVHGAISVANAVKNSPIPPLFFALVKTFFAFAMYLDLRFQLHQKLAVMLVAVLEGLVEIEREVGLLRKGGEGLSVLWEAFVKGTIALAKSEPYPQPAPQPQAHFAHPNFDHTHPHSYPGTPPFRAHTQQEAAHLPYLASQPHTFAYSTQDENDGEVHHYPLDDIPSDFELDSRQNRPPTRQVSPHFLAVDAASGAGVRKRTLRRTAFSSPSLPRLENGDAQPDQTNGEGTQYPFPPSYDQAGEASASGYYNPRPPRQRSRSEHSSETIIGSGRHSPTRNRGRHAGPSGSSTPNAEEKRASWVGRVVAGAAGRIGGAR